MSPFSIHKRASAAGSEMYADGKHSVAGSASYVTDTGLSSITDEDAETEGGDGGTKFVASVTNRA